MVKEGRDRDSEGRKEGGEGMERKGGDEGRKGRGGEGRW